MCEFGRIDDLRGLLARAGLSVHPLKGRQLRMFLAAAALGGSPAEFDEESPVEVEIGRRDVRIGGHLTRSLHLGRWPRSLAPGFLQGLMAASFATKLGVLRATLYMGALVASRYNPVIRDFYRRLLAAGKPKKLALTACMRKLLVILNSMLKHRSPWCDVTPQVVAHPS